MSDIKFKVNIIAPEGIKQKMVNYIENNSNKKIVFDSENPNITIKIDAQKTYWIVDLDVSSFNYLKFVPMINLMLYKFFFLYNNQIDPIKIRLSNTYGGMENMISMFLLNMSIWGLISFSSSEIIREKIKKTALIFNNVNMFIISKSIVNSMIFLLILILYNLLFNKLSFNDLVHYFVAFSVFVYVHGFLSWVIKNPHILSLFNLLIGFFIMFLPFYSQSLIFDLGFWFLFTMLFAAIILSLIITKKNKELQKVVWE
ncbi:MAG: hypothetical protein RMJ36_01720 [Candidatus Calescibacterium sp.]|nr:hypothetical protein [Candidatus Calescibacterium sp.]MDW8132356.1 hypothetical protein [Candidatus Calescibacterium sp.]